MSDIEGKAARVGASKPGGERVSIKKVEDIGRVSRARPKVRTKKNGACGRRDTEGKVTRVGESKPGGERVSIRK